MICNMFRCFELCADIDLSFLSAPLTELASKSPTGFVIVLILAICAVIMLIVSTTSIKHYRNLAEASMNKTEEAYHNAFLLATNNQEEIARIELTKNNDSSKKKKKKKKKKHFDFSKIFRKK